MRPLEVFRLTRGLMWAVFLLNEINGLQVDNIGGFDAWADNGRFRRNGEVRSA